MSWYFQRTSAVVWLGLGLLAGLLVASFWPSVPLHAVSTDKIDSFSMATGPVEDYEAVYFLDHLTGDLHAFVVGRTAVRSATGFGVIEHCYRNVLQDFKTEEDKSPKFLMATGHCDLVRGGVNAPSLPSRSILYIADVRSGAAAAYAVPYNTTQHLSGRFIETEFVPITKFPIRKVAAVGHKKGKAAAKDDSE
jgi:hypothetical protein